MTEKQKKLPGEDVGGQSFQNPDGSYYDAATKIYSDTEGRKFNLNFKDALNYKAKVPVEGKKLDTKMKGKEARVKAKTKVELANLKMDMAELQNKLTARDFLALFNHLKLQGKKTSSQPVPPKFDFQGERQFLLKDDVLAKLPDKDYPVEVLRSLKLDELSPADVKNFFAGVIVTSLIKRLEEEWQDKGKRKFFAQYSKEKKGRIVQYKFEFDSATTFKLVVEPESFHTEYMEYLKKERAKLTATQKAEQDRQNQANLKTKEEKIDALKKSPAGFLLGILGYNNKGKDGKTGFERLLAGEDWFGRLILGFFGNKEYRPYYEGALSALSPKGQAMVKAYEKKFGAGSSFVKKIEGVQGKITALKFGPIGLERFSEYVNGGLKLSNGVKLGKDYPIAKLLKFTGGSLILPAGYVLRKGKVEEVTDAPSKTYDASEAPVEIKGGILPKGTAFTEGVKFAKEKIAA